LKRNPSGHIKSPVNYFDLQHSHQGKGSLLKFSCGKPQNKELYSECHESFCTQTLSDVHLNQNALYRKYINTESIFYTFIEDT